jgi:hypothetical protein
VAFDAFPGVFFLELSLSFVFAGSFGRQHLGVKKAMSEEGHLGIKLTERAVVLLGTPGRLVITFMLKYEIKFCFKNLNQDWNSS